MGAEGVNARANIENLDARLEDNKLKEHEELDNAQREELKTEFFNMPETQGIRQSIGKNTTLTDQDKDNIYERLITQLGRHKSESKILEKSGKINQPFDIVGELRNMLTDGSLPLKSGPKADPSKSYEDFQVKNKEFKIKLIDELVGKINSVGEQDGKDNGIKKVDAIHSVGSNKGASAGNIMSEGDKGQGLKQPVLPKNYDSAEAAPQNAQGIVGEVCSDCRDILENGDLGGLTQNEEAITQQFDTLSDHTINDPKTSVMNRLVESGELSTETNQLIDSTIANDREFDKEFVKSVNNSEDLSKVTEKLKLIPENRDSVPVKNLSSFKEDFPDFADIAINGTEATSLNEGDQPSGYEISAYENIAENYIKIGESPEDKQKNFSTAIKTAGANLLKNDTVIKRDSVEFKHALNSIHSDNSERQFEGLINLITIKETDKTENAAKGRKIENRSKNSTRTRVKLEKELSKLREEFTVLREASSDDNLQKRIDIGKKGKEIQELLQKKAPKSGDVMKGGKLDVASSNNELLVESS